MNSNLETCVGSADKYFILKFLWTNKDVLKNLLSKSPKSGPNIKRIDFVFFRLKKYNIVAIEKRNGNILREGLIPRFSSKYSWSLSENFSKAASAMCESKTPIWFKTGLNFDTEIPLTGDHTNKQCNFINLRTGKTSNTVVY